MKTKLYICSVILLLLSCTDPNQGVIDTAETVIKSIIDNPESYQYKDLELLETTTYARNIKFWENYYRQMYINEENPDFEKDLTALKEKYKDKMDANSAYKYKIFYSSEIEGKQTDKTRVLYFGPEDEKVQGWVYSYGLDAYELEGLKTFEKYGKIIN